MRDYKLEETLRKEYNLIPFSSLTKEPNLSLIVYGTEENITKLHRLIIELIERKYNK